MKALMDKADFMESKTELMVQVEGPEETGEVKEQVSFKLQTKGWGGEGRDGEDNGNNFDWVRSGLPGY